MTPIIREAVASDIPVLDAIEQESFALGPWDAGSFLKYSCFVAELEHRVAGFLVSREVFPGIQGARPEREILNLAVAPVYRRLGIATALLRHELSLNATHYLDVRESNVGARKLYEHLGFTEVGRRTDYYTCPIENAIVMEMK
ncbi:MAG: GNAT family N-acetyltransferase [Acidobacteriota bacterium]|nr:GNAT family N-acetyltransferase [Acidobacteriota bacterium]